MRRCNCDACQIRHEDDQAERDRLATEIANEIGDAPESESAIVQRIVDNDPTDRVHITSMDARLAELAQRHDASAPLYPEFAPPARRRGDGAVYSMDDYRRDLDVTRTDWPAMPDREPSWGQVLRMGIVDAIKEVL